MTPQRWKRLRDQHEGRVSPKVNPPKRRVRARVPVDTYSSLKKRMRYFKRGG